MDRATDILARRLFEAGCRTAFGIPGGETLTLLDSLVKAGIAFVLCKHENAAGFMAEGTHHRTGAPGLLVTTIGPGVANAVNVVANAQQDRVPLIVLTGSVDPDEALTYTHQVFDHRTLFDSVTKATFTLTPNGADVIADKALAIALADRPGPVLIDIPIGAADTAPDKLLRSRHIPPARVAPAEGPALAEARSWLAGARKPVLVAGLDVLNHAAAGELRRFVETFQAPVITTYKAKGVLPEDDPLALGAAGLSPLADRILLPLVRQADLILAVGYDPIEMRAGWRDAWDPAKQRVVEIVAAGDFQYMHHATVRFVCHVGEGLKALSRGVTPGRTWAGTEAAAVRRTLKETFSSKGGWGPAAVVEAIRTVFPRDTVATVDTGAHRTLLNQIWEAYEPRGLLQSTGLCTMGCALPLAMGAAMADPGRPVVAVSGDGGLLMVLGELATLAERKLPVTIVVFADASLSLIEMKQRSRGLANAGVNFGAVDFGAVARALGGAGETVSDRASLEAALARARRRTEQFTVIGAVFDRRSYDGTI